MENCIETAIRALEDYYQDNGLFCRDLQYTYGYMDALAVLKGLDTNRQIRRDHRNILTT